MHHLKKIIPFIAFLIVTLSSISLANEADVTVIAHQLNNPRGIVIMPDNSLLLVEAGDGTSEPETDSGTGRILHLVDRNGDGDFDDDNERSAMLSDEPAYNALALFPAFHDEVFGLGDILLLENGRIFFTKDDPFYEKGIQHATESFEFY